MTLAIYGKTGEPPAIRSLEDWKRFAPPKKAPQWKRGRSAMEFARAWIGGGTPHAPPELERLLASHEETRGLLFRRAFGELETRFDDTQRGPRNHDLLVEAERGGLRVVLGIEGKERESFGKTLDAEIRVARRRSERTQLPARIDSFCKALLGRAYGDDLADLRYQLLTGVTGTLVEAKRRKAAVAVFVVHQFHSAETSPRNLARNVADYTRFMGLLFPASDIENGCLLGPLDTPGSKLVPAGRLFVGKITTDI